jgi:RNA polymerase II-associated factor 1
MKFFELKLTLDTAIQAPLHPPVPHPHDRPLLRSLSTLGKPKFSDSGVSFLRRTEYISSYTSKSRFESTTSRSLIGNVGSRSKKAVQDIDKESPEYIKAQVEKSFEVTAKALQTRNVQHPSKRNLKLVDAYPLFPDLYSFPEAGGYVTIKFTTNPVPPSTSYDTRLESSLLMPMPPSEEEELAKQAAKEAYERDPERNPPPNDTIEYEFFMNESASEGHKFKRKFDTLDSDNEDEDLYTHKNEKGEGCFRFKRIRAYESQVASGSQAGKYDDEVVIAIHDGNDGLRSKGAYYYPLVQKISIRPQRQKNIDLKRHGLAPSQDDPTKGQVDFVDLRIEEADETTKKERESFALYPLGKEDGDVDAAQDNRDGSSPEPRDD